MNSSHETVSRQDKRSTVGAAPTRPGPASKLAALILAVALMATTTAVAAAQAPTAVSRTVSDPVSGTCADLGMTVVEPVSVSWEADWVPALNPRFLWAYGDVDLLWDDSLTEYWYHWFQAVPGPDPYVRYQFEPGTTIEGVQYHNSWSDGDLLLVAIDQVGAPVAAPNAVDVVDAYSWNAAALDPVSTTAMKLTTSTQNVKLYEVDFCTQDEGEQQTLDLSASSPSCESISAGWTQQPGADFQVVVVDGANNQIDTQSGLTNAYGPVTVPPGAYSVTLTATIPTAGGGSESISETVTLVVAECATPPVGCGANNDPADAYCQSVNVIESFGDAPLPAGAGVGHQWHMVNQYYNSYGDRPGMCSIEVHNSYWTAVRASDGELTYYPSWHAPIHDPGGPAECRFTHEHGEDPRQSDLYDEDRPTNIGAPFGFVHPAGLASGDRIEDHVGHKIVVENDFKLTTNNPYSEGVILNLFELNGSPVTCDWYSKLHQGTHSRDALGFNLHEYYLNFSCDDGTEVRIKEMTDFGFRAADTNPFDGDQTSNVTEPPGLALNGGPGTVDSDCGWFATNMPGPSSDPDPSPDSDFGDAKRGFTCLMGDAKIEELWKASAYLSAPDGAATVAYDPYYVVKNSSRFALYGWWDYLDQDGDHVGENAMISMVDFCVEGSELRNELSRPDAPSNFVKIGANYPGQFRVQTYCDSIDQSVRDQWAQDISNAGSDNQALMVERNESVDNVFLGTRRGVHVKGVVVYGGQANFGPLAFFCSDHLGNASAWPTNPSTGAPVTSGNPWSAGDPTPVCADGVPQLLSAFNNGHGPVEGSTAGATPIAGGGLQGNGPANEIIIDMDALYPDHGIRAPN